MKKHIGKLVDTVKNWWQQGMERLRLRIKKAKNFCHRHELNTLSFWTSNPAGIIVSVPVGTLIYIIFVILITPIVQWALGVDKKSVITTIITTSGGIALIINALHLKRRADAQDKTANASIQANEQSLFETGIKQLGSDSESVRLGGIYILYELAVEKPKRTKNIVEILCAHVRAHTNQEEYKKSMPANPPMK